MTAFESSKPPAPYILTDRLVLKLLKPSAAPLMVRVRIENRHHLGKWEPTRSPQFYTETFWQTQLRVNQIDFERGESCCLVMLDRAEQQVFGVINFTQITRGTVQSCQLGYSLAQKVEGQGYMYEALMAAIDYAFSGLGLHRVMANYIPHNQRSANLLARLGFEIEGRARGLLLINGAWEDHVLTAKINPADT